MSLIRVQRQQQNHLGQTLGGNVVFELSSKAQQLQLPTGSGYWTDQVLGIIGTNLNLILKRDIEKKIGIAFFLFAFFFVLFFVIFLSPYPLPYPYPTPLTCRAFRRIGDEIPTNFSGFVELWLEIFPARVLSADSCIYFFCTSFGRTDGEIPTDFFWLWWSSGWRDSKLELSFQIPYSPTPN